MNISGAEAFARRAVLSGPPGSGPPNQRREDWTCPKCQANVFGSKTECFKCGTKRPFDASRPSQPTARQAGRMPELYSIKKGKVVRVADFGAFVEMEGCTKWGLVHVTQMTESKGRGERIEPKDIVDVGDDVWVKVCDIDEEQGKISLSMKHVSQASGRDMDPENAEYLVEKSRRSGPGGHRDRERKIDIDDPLARPGQFREDAWALLQKKSKRGHDARPGDYEIVRSPSPDHDARRMSGGDGRDNAREEAKKLKAMLKEDKKKKDKKKKDKKHKKHKKHKKEKSAKKGSSSSSDSND